MPRPVAVVSNNITMIIVMIGSTSTNKSNQVFYESVCTISDHRGVGLLVSPPLFFPCRPGELLLVIRG